MAGESAAPAGVGAGLIKTELFAAVTFIVLVTTLVTPLLLRLSFAEEISHA